MRKKDNYEYEGKGESNEEGGVGKDDRENEKDQNITLASLQIL